MLIGGFIIVLFVGFLTGAFGIGGGFLMIPALIIIGVQPNVAVATDLATILATSSLGIFKRRKTGTVDYKLALSIAVGCVPGVFCGWLILRELDKMTPLIINGREVVAVKFILLCTFLPLLCWIAGFLAFDYRKNKDKKSDKRVGLFSKIKLPPYVNYPTLDEPKLSLPALIILGMPAGLMTGMMGIGGGVILLPGLIYLIGQHTVKAAGTSLALVWISSLIAVGLNILGEGLLNNPDADLSLSLIFSFFKEGGNINYDLLIVMLAGGLIGTYFGTKVGLKAKGVKMRLYFVYVVLTAVVLISYKIIQMIFGWDIAGQ